MTLRYFFVQIVFLILCLGSVEPASAQWSDNPNVNNPICVATLHQYAPRIAKDGSGGAIIAWNDNRTSTVRIYAQRINNLGVNLWPANGIVVCAPSGTIDVPNIVSDGADGAIIAWVDSRNGNNDVFAQHVDGNGNVLWGPNGTDVCTQPGAQISVVMASDGAGGAVFAWEDYRTGVEIWSQHIDYSGTLLWPAAGIPICTTTGNHYIPAILADGTGGAVIAWQDSRNGNIDIYAQRVNSAGVVQWATNGVGISTATLTQQLPILATDGTGGAIIAWDDNRNGTQDIYAQRISGGGVVQWSANGISICTLTNGQDQPTIISDGAGGAFLAWEDFRNGSYYAIYGQRVDLTGANLWTANGKLLCSSTGAQYSPSITGDGADGAIVTWLDYRNGVDYDLYAQHLNGGGVFQWSSYGVAVSTAPATQSGRNTLVSDDAGGAIFAWQDSRNSPPYSDIYAQRIYANSLLGDGRPVIQSVADVQNDQGGQVNLFWKASPYDVLGDYNPINSYSIFRGSSPSAVPDGAVFLSVKQYMEMKRQGTLTASHFITTPSPKSVTGPIYWQWIADVAAYQLPNYVYTVPTIADSGPQGTSLEYFMVTANIYGAYYYASAPDSGYSVDNLAPFPPMGIIASLQAGPHVRLGWTPPSESDFGHYDVYRSDENVFSPSPGLRIGSSVVPGFVDTAPLEGKSNYYRVIAVDVHGNVGLPSSIVGASVSVSEIFSTKDKWNLVSVPLTVSDYAKASLFPTAVSHAYAYQGAYVAFGTLENRTGYWIKFNGSQHVAMTGLLRDDDTIQVTTGWNLLGSISTPIASSSIGSIPGGLVTSRFFGYSGSYQSTDTIQPGAGYWVKVSASGRLILSSTATAASAASIRIVPTNEDPPTPPEEVSSDPDLIPTSFELAQNYPNPFNPVTTIKYSLPADVHVTLTVYNMLGEVVTTLVDEEQGAGLKSVSFDAGTLPSGMYVYKISAGTFTNMKKLLLIK